MGGSQAAANDNRPGGGLGAPIDAPDPLHDYRVYLLGAFALVLVMGGALHRVAIQSPAGGRRRRGGGGAGAGKQAHALLDAMKEELFQLELDRQQGKISAEEYAKAKSALDETMKRALARAKNA